MKMIIKYLKMDQINIYKLLQTQAKGRDQLVGHGFHQGKWVEVAVTFQELLVSNELSEVKLFSNLAEVLVLCRKSLPMIG